MRCHSLTPFYRMSQLPLSQDTQCLASTNFPLREATSCKEKQDQPVSSLDRAYGAWLASREDIPHRKNRLAPGGQRPFNCANVRLAISITKLCAYDFCKTLITLHPGRTTLMLCLNVIRSLSPAYRGYWQAVALNEVCVSPSHNPRGILRSVNTVPIPHRLGKFQLDLPCSIDRG
jgi:hypothetical protein